MQWTTRAYFVAINLGPNKGFLGQPNNKIHFRYWANQSGRQMLDYMTWSIRFVRPVSFRPIIMGPVHGIIERDSEIRQTKERYVKWEEEKGIN